MKLLVSMIICIGIILGCGDKIVAPPKEEAMNFAFLIGEWKAKGWEIVDYTPERRPVYDWVNFSYIFKDEAEVYVWKWDVPTTGRRWWETGTYSPVPIDSTTFWVLFTVKEASVRGIEGYNYSVEFERRGEYLVAQGLVFRKVRRAVKLPP